jgi:hypothetical protein
MNKLLLILPLVLIGCSTNQPTRQVLICQREYILGNDALFVGGSRTKDEIECKIVRVPVASKAVPLPVDSKLIDKSTY